jgi:hypothetical protein
MECSKQFEGIKRRRNMVKGGKDEPQEQIAFQQQQKAEQRPQCQQRSLFDF